MASLTRQRIGIYTYIYLSHSFWDKEKQQPRNNKIRVGKLDPKTGDEIYDPKYHKDLVQFGIIIKPTQKNIYNKNIILNEPKEMENKLDPEKFFDSVKDFGAFYFLKSIAEKLGLLKILAASIKELWQEIFMIACYLILENEALMNFDLWSESVDGFNIENLTSQRISEILSTISVSERNLFYRKWYDLIKSTDYVALDITSVSSYSTQIVEVERGYNRDKEKLPQINFCLLFGEESKLPVYQTNYNGSLSDVTTLENTMSELLAITGNCNIPLVTDKGFYSQKNINMLLNNNHKFLIAVPFTNSWSLNFLEKHKKTIVDLSNAIHINDNTVFSDHEVIIWPIGKNKENKAYNIHAFLYYNFAEYSKELSDLYGYVSFLKNIALSDPDNKDYKEDILIYLEVKRLRKTGKVISIKVKEEVITAKLKTKGCFVLISNYLDSKEKALQIYRSKDVVEKAFAQFKNNLGMERLRVHKKERVDNKSFISFISLIIVSHINKIMSEKKLYKNFTIKRLLKILATLKTCNFSGKKIVRSVTKNQKLIFKNFEISAPKN